jgi:IS5 family transposase
MGKYGLSCGRVFLLSFVKRAKIAIFRGALKELIPWESLRSLHLQDYVQEQKSNAGRKPIDPAIILKMLLLQQLYNLSDEEFEYQGNDRRSFKELIGLGILDSIPDAKTVWLFRKD